MAAVHPADTAGVPASAATLSGVDKDALISRLDALLEQYLNTLDLYEQLMQQLSKQLSSGFFSLTQANFHNRSGVHYGQDSYDERIQATRKILVTEKNDSQLDYSTTNTPLPPRAKESTDKDAEPNAEPHSPDHPDQPQPTNPAINTPTPPSADPIRMFGILVPPTLRTAQSSFVDAVDGPVVQLARVVGELRALEREVGRVRKGIRRA